MSMRNQMTSPDTDADLALPGMVASFPRTRVVVVIKHLFVTLAWRTREQRERE
jgi:hypothetical protein